jgi:hypothetical protein
MTTVLLNITESNNNWNRSVLDMSWREREVTHGLQTPERAERAAVKPQTGHAQISPDAKHPSKQ